MQYQSLGNTGIQVSRLGLGTVKFGRSQGLKYPLPFQIPTQSELETLLATAFELGITLLDTAPSYGNSEERLGLLLEKTRKQWVLSTKLGEEFSEGHSTFNFTPEYARFSVERSLKRLKTDYLDIVLVHSDGNDVHNIQHFGILDCLRDLKDQGLILSYGMSTKTIEGGLLALQKSDLVMVAYNPQYQEEQKVIEEAKKAGKGVFIKKALMSGHLDYLQGSDPKGSDPVETTLNFVLQTPGVTSIIMGTINPEHLIHNCSVIKNT